MVSTFSPTIKLDFHPRLAQLSPLQQLASHTRVPPETISKSVISETLATVGRLGWYDIHNIRQGLVFVQVAGMGGVCCQTYDYTGVRWVRVGSNTITFTAAEVSLSCSNVAFYMNGTIAVRTSVDPFHRCVQLR